MNELLISNVLLEGRKCDILIEGNRFTRISPAGAGLEAAAVLDAEGKAILPALYNTHTHAAMTLLRGYADDMALGKWLGEYIWPSMRMSHLRPSSRTFDMRSSFI